MRGLKKQPRVGRVRLVRPTDQSRPSNCDASASRCDPEECHFVFWRQFDSFKIAAFAIGQRGGTARLPVWPPLPPGSASLLDGRANARHRWRAVSLEGEFNSVRTRARTPGPNDLFAYNVLSASEADLDRIAELLRDVFRDVRAVVAASNPTQQAALLNIHLLRFTEPERPNGKNDKRSSRS